MGRKESNQTNKQITRAMCIEEKKQFSTDTVHTFAFKVRKKAKIRNQYNQATHLTQDTTWESNKCKIKHQTQESQEVRWPQGYNEQTRKHDKHETQITKMIHKSALHS